MNKITELSILSPLKVFVEYDPQYDIYVAQCLETGHLVTADETETAKDMIVELLEHEVSLAFHTDDLSRLANPAPLLMWVKYALAAKAHTPEGRTIKLQTEFPAELKLLIGRVRSKLDKGGAGDMNHYIQDMALFAVGIAIAGIVWETMAAWRERRQNPRLPF